LALIRSLKRHDCAGQSSTAVASDLIGKRRRRQRRSGRIGSACRCARRREGFGGPSGWAGLRALGVDPTVRGLGIGHVLMQVCLDRARAAGAAVLCLHTAEFMTTAAAMYQAMGFRRVPSFDFDAARHLRLRGAQPIRIVAYRLDLPKASL
jgi:GNAT superfamily N-acetyltransferase